MTHECNGGPLIVGNVRLNALVDRGRLDRIRDLRHGSGRKSNILRRLLHLMAWKTICPSTPLETAVTMPDRLEKEPLSFGLFPVLSVL